MEFFKIQSAQEVKKLLEQLARMHLLEVEILPIIEAVDRITSKAIVAPIDLPEFNRSTVDGYAVISEEVMGASEAIPAFLQIMKEVEMGENVDFVLRSGTTAYVPTGGMIPKGTDGMVMIEHTGKLDESTLLFYKPIAPGENITFIGDDLKKGEVVVGKGKRLNPYDIGLLAAMGICEIEVYKMPRFSIISTGDEIIEPSAQQGIGKVRDINGYALSAAIRQLPGEVTYKVIVKDDFTALKQALESALELSDIVLISGGSSVGARDYTYQVIEAWGQVHVHGISIKPGKPTIVGQVGHKIVFGLPGHPAAAMIVFNVFVKSLVDHQLKQSRIPFSIQAFLEGSVHSSPGKDTYQMVQLRQVDGEWYALPLYGKSGMMTLLSKATGYICIPSSIEGLQKGEKVEVCLFQEVNI